MDNENLFELDIEFDWVSRNENWDDACDCQQCECYELNEHGEFVLIEQEMECTHTEPHRPGCICGILRIDQGRDSFCIDKDIYLEHFNIFNALNIQRHMEKYSIEEQLKIIIIRLSMEDCFYFNAPSIHEIDNLKYDPDELNKLQRFINLKAFW